jgi:hypothetical protein
MLPVPYMTHTPQLDLVRDSDGRITSYAIDAETEQFLQTTRLVAGLVGGPVVFYGGGKLSDAGYDKLGLTLKAMGVACSIYHLAQYIGVKMAERGTASAEVAVRKNVQSLAGTIAKKVIRKNAKRAIRAVLDDTFDLNNDE